MQLRRHAPPAEQHHAEERGFEEERRQHFVREQRAEDVAGAYRQHRPVGAELEAHDDAGDDAQPNDTAKIFSQKKYRSRHSARRV